MAAESPWSARCQLGGGKAWGEGMGEGERKGGIFAIPKQLGEEGTPGGGKGNQLVLRVIRLRRGD